MAYNEPSMAPRKAPPGKYQLEVIPTTEFNSTFSDTEKSTQYTSVALSLSITFRGSIIKTTLVAQNKNNTSIIYISQDQANNFSDQSIENAICASCPGLWEKILSARGQGIALPFTEQARESVYYPLTKEVAANIILAFFNAGADPLDRIQLTISPTKEGGKAVSGRMLTTYYLCCIKYLTDLDMFSVLGDEPKCDALLDDLQIVKPKFRQAYLGLKEHKRDIPKEMLAFHAVYGAYVMCRPVVTKRNFREWVTKRYSSFLASIQYAPETGIHLPLQDGGNRVNEVVIERSTIRKVIYKLTQSQSEQCLVPEVLFDTGRRFESSGFRKY